MVRHLRKAAVGHLRRQLSLPGSWFAVGLFALLSGIAFLHLLNQFIDQSAQALTAPPPVPVNINQLLIRPFLLQAALAALLVLPVVTSRAYAGRRFEDADAADTAPRSHTRVVLATFLASCTVYMLMLIVTACLIATLFVYGSPEWESIISGYVGLVLTGAAFISVALLISSLATSPAAAWLATFAVALALASAAWLTRFGVAGARPAFQYLSVADALDDFGKGVLDTGHLISCLSIIALALYLTTQTLDPHRADGAIPQ